MNQELVEVSVNGTRVLEVGGGLQVGDSSNVSMGRAKFLFEFSTEVFPVNKSVRLWIFFFPTEYLGSPLICSSGLHAGKGPDNFSLVIGETVWTQTDVGLAGAEEGHSIGIISVKL